jgi:hypothetical protein
MGSFITSTAPARSPFIKKWLLRIAPFVIFFLTLLLITIPRGLKSMVSVFNLPLLTFSDEAAKKFGGSDAGSLLNAAISLRAHEAIAPDALWVYNLWPPAMIWVDRVLLSFESRFDIPIVLSMVLLNCAVWATFLAICFTLILRVCGLRLAILFSAGIFLYSGLNSWGVRGGLFYSDSFGAMAFCLGILTLFMAWRASTRKQQILLSILAGVFLAVACYFRASFELVADATLVISIVLIVLSLFLFRSLRANGAARATTRTLIPLFVMSAAAQLLLTPWRLYVGAKVRSGGDFRWTTTSDLTSAARWIPDKVLLDAGAGFAAEGHSNWACIDDRVQCAKIYNLEKTSVAPYTPSGGGHFTAAQFDHMTLQSILKHPFNYIFERLDALSFGFASNTGGSVKDLALPESIILVVLAVSVLVLVVRRKQLTSPAYLFFFFATAIQFATIAFIHMEPRYFLGIELSVIVLAPFALMDSRTRRANETMIANLQAQHPQAESKPLR